MIEHVGARRLPDRRGDAPRRVTRECELKAVVALNPANIGCSTATFIALRRSKRTRRRPNARPIARSTRLAEPVNPCRIFSGTIAATLPSCVLRRRDRRHGAAGSRHGRVSVAPTLPGDAGEETQPELTAELPTPSPGRRADNAFLRLQALSGTDAVERRLYVGSCGIRRRPSGFSISSPQSA